MEVNGNQKKNMLIFSPTTTSFLAFTSTLHNRLNDRKHQMGRLISTGLCPGKVDRVGRIAEVLRTNFIASAYIRRQERQKKGTIQYEG
jgi:hypothetical protein